MPRAQRSAQAERDTDGRVTQVGWVFAMEKYRRNWCGFVFDPTEGDPGKGISPGTAIDLNPNLAFAEGVLSMAYSQIGDYDNTLIHAQNAARLSPRDPARLLWNLARAAAAFATDRYEESLEWGKTLTEIAPDYPAGWRVRVAACSALDRAEEARTALDRLLGLAPRDSLRLIEAVHPYEPELRARYIDCLRKAGMPEK